MKKGILLFTALAGTFMSGYLVAGKCIGLPTAQETATAVTPAEEHPGRRDPWELFIEALIQVESGGREDAEGRDGDAGVLQIRPCMVAEANRLLGAEVYSLDDRYSREKSIGMWSAVQDIRNPSHGIREALRLHNPRASKRYVEEVLERFYRLAADTYGME